MVSAHLQVFCLFKIKATSTSVEPLSSNTYQVLPCLLSMGDGSHPTIRCLQGPKIQCSIRK